MINKLASYNTWTNTWWLTIHITELVPFLNIVPTVRVITKWLQSKPLNQISILMVMMYCISLMDDGVLRYSTSCCKFNFHLTYHPKTKGLISLGTCLINCTWQSLLDFRTKQCIAPSLQYVAYVPWLKYLFYYFNF